LSAEGGGLVTLITAADCHLCEHARMVLSTLAAETRLSVSEVSWESEEGRRLVSRDGVAFPPAVYLNGILAGYGRISARALRRQLAELSL
jgi:hypothetical protein